ARAQIAELHREVRVLHLPGHRLFQPALKAERRVDVQLGARHERRDEEGKALDVVPVGVPDEEMQARRERDLREVEAQAAGARLDVAPALAQAAPVRIGVLAAKAGVTAPVGESGLRGTQFAVDRINAAGGIAGRKVELVVEEESNPKDTVERFRKLALQTK